jgi:signal transduction histidine kinase
MTVPRDASERIAVSLRGDRLASVVAPGASRDGGRSLALLTHELRTPLSAILGYAHLLADGIPEPIPGKAREQVKRIAACAAHLTDVIDQVMAYSRLEAGDNGVHLGPVDVAKLVSGVVSIVQPLADRKGLALRTRLDEAPRTFEADAGRLRQILLNLVGNAVKFTDEGDVTLVAHRSSGNVMFHVHDCGPGIAPDEQARIFEPFVQGEASADTRRGGTGLGLAISRMLARSLDGDVVVSSTRGEGSTFTLWLPAARDTQAA